MSFALDLQRFADKYDRNANAVVRKIILDLGTSLVRKSPVGDPDFWLSKNSDSSYSYLDYGPKGYVGGRFRANWQYGNGLAPSGTVEGVDPNGAATVLSIASSIGSNPAGRVHYLVNNLPYAQRLEDGWSRQAPKGMVALTVREFIPIVELAARAVEK